MVYIEKIILLDCFIHYVMLYLSSFICLIRLSKVRITISLILNIVVLCVYIYISRNSLVVWSFILLISVISFLSKNIKEMIRGIVIYLGLNIILGGISEIVYLAGNLNNFTLIFLIALVFLIIVIYKLVFKIRINLSSIIYKLIVIDKGKRYVLKGYLDTGNLMESSNFYPIIVLSKRYKIGKLIGHENCFTITGSSTLDLFKVDNIYIEINKHYKEVKAYIAYSRIAYDAMFGLKIIGG